MSNREQTLAPFLEMEHDIRYLRLAEDSDTILAVQISEEENTAGSSRISEIVCSAIDSDLRGYDRNYIPLRSRLSLAHRVTSKSLCRPQTWQNRNNRSLKQAESRNMLLVCLLPGDEPLRYPPCPCSCTRRSCWQSLLYGVYIFLSLP